MHELLNSVTKLRRTPWKSEMRLRLVQWTTVPPKSIIIDVWVSESELMVGGTLSGGLDRKRRAWTWKGEMDCHLRRRDHQVDVHGGKKINGHFWTRLRLSERSRYTRTGRKLLTRSNLINAGG